MGSSNLRAQPRLLMTPAFLIELSLKTFRHPRVSAIIDRVAPRARCSGAAAGAGVFTLPWSIRVAFANPTAVLAEQASHSASYPVSGLGRIDVSANVAAIGVVAIEKLAAGTRHQRAQFL
jgi:hypothetical protein